MIKILIWIFLDGNTFYSKYLAFKTWESELFHSQDWYEMILDFHIHILISDFQVFDFQFNARETIESID